MGIGLVGSLFYAIAGFPGIFALAIDTARPLLGPAMGLLALGWPFSIVQAGIQVKASIRSDFT